MKLSDVPIISKDITSRLTEDKALVVSVNRVKGYILENLAFDVWKSINNCSTVKEIISLCSKKKNINKHKIIQTLKDLEKFKLIYFKY